MTAPMPGTPLVTTAGVAKLFEPKAIAIVGSSLQPSSIGSRARQYLEKAGFKGRVINVNPKYAGELGFVASLKELEKGEVDLALVLVSASNVLSVLEECAECGVGIVAIGSAGFGESGVDGRLLEQQIGRRAQELGVRVLGPNCLGVVNARHRNYATFGTLSDNAVVDSRVGSVAIVSQSGAIASFLVSLLEKEGVLCNTWVSTGNELDIDVAECIAYLSERADIRLILVYLEGCRDGARLRQSISAARVQGKHVAVLKAGRSAAGATAIASHTASVVGEDRLYEAAITTSGGIRLTCFSDAVLLAQLLQFGGDPDASALGILTVSGGVGALMADEAEELGLELPTLTEETQMLLAQKVPFASFGNPLDTTAQVTNSPEAMGDLLDGMVESALFSAFAVFVGPASVNSAYGVPLARSIATTAARWPGYMLAIGSPNDEVASLLEQAKVPFVEDAVRAVRLIGTLTRTTIRPSTDSGNTSEFAIPVSFMDAAESGVIGEVTVKQYLHSIGLEIPRAEPVSSANDVESFLRYDGSVVLKALSPGVAHKSDLGLVRLGLRTMTDVVEAIASMREAARRHGIEIDLIAEEQVEKGVEVLVNVREDLTFGTVLTVGSGGIGVEADDDLATFFGIPSESDFIEGLSALRVWSKLAGSRGGSRGDVGELYRLVTALVRAATENAHLVREWELNPVAVMDLGRGVVVLDAIAFGA